MNCANHADASAVAYCRTCGKPLCASCTRPVRGVIYCEDCLGAKMEGTVPPAAPGFVSDAYPSAGYRQAVPPSPGSSGPNPALAGILGIIPGIGAVYNGQYARGLAHLTIFVLLVIGCSVAGNEHSTALGVFCGVGLGFFEIYQIFDAVRSAKAIQAAQPIPDPFGLAAAFGGGGGKIETSKVPIGSVVLILLGVLFLLHTMGLTEVGLDRFWPLILIALGGWIFARNWGLTGTSAGCQCARCRARRVMGPAMLLTIGILFLLDVTLHGPGFGRTWPLILLVAGAVKLLQGSASVEGHVPSLAASPQGTPTAPMNPVNSVAPVSPVPPASTSGEVNRG
jgi:hypothetical protein